MAVDFPSREDGLLRLRYRDDGPGFPPEVLRGAPSRMGLHLLRAIAEGELHGRVSFRNEPGATAIICFSREAPGEGASRSASREPDPPARGLGTGGDEPD